MDVQIGEGIQPDRQMVGLVELLESPHLIDRNATIIS
jgi:hypothetical protein